MNKNGFTLIEILLTISFLFVGLLALLQVFPAAFGLERAGYMKTQAILLAQEKIEAINSQGYETTAPGDVFEDALAPPFQLFSRRTIISYVDANLQDSLSDSGLKKVSVVVSWKTSLPLLPGEFSVASLIPAK
ncbi:MAG: hypothetical protein PHU56_01665 [Candidatus Pacebacteria bacterium]|nr:hypothetical protein [Candidatus Paceibacterota bacterium]